MKVMTSRELLFLQIRVIASLVIRESRAAFGTTALGYAWAVITPVAAVGFLVVIFTSVGRQAPFGSSFTLFFATGILPLLFFNDLANKLMAVFRANKALLTYPIIKDIDTLLARSLLVCATHVLIMVCFFSALSILDFGIPPYRPEHVIFAFLATWLLGSGFGALNAVIVSLWSTWSDIKNVLLRPLFFVSGVFYVPSFLPPDIRAFLEWNPVLHVIEWFRFGFYANYNSIILDVWYPIIVGAVMFLFALMGERMFRRARF